MAPVLQVRKLLLRQVKWIVHVGVRGRIGTQLCLMTKPLCHAVSGIWSHHPSLRHCLFPKEGSDSLTPGGGSPHKSEGCRVQVGQKGTELRAQECREGRLLPRLATRSQGVRYLNRGSSGGPDSTPGGGRGVRQVRPLARALLDPEVTTPDQTNEDREAGRGQRHTARWTRTRTREAPERHQRLHSAHGSCFLSGHTGTHTPRGRQTDTEPGTHSEHKGSLRHIYAPILQVPHVPGPANSAQLISSWSLHQA